MPSQTDLRAITDRLNGRQRAYLLAVYGEDQLREAANKGRMGAPPARTWRWIEYGPVGARFLDSHTAFLLRRELERRDLVDQGTGATWAALVAAGLVETRHAHTGFADRRTGRPILSLLVKMTTTGRKVARILKGEPLTRPKADKPLSLAALRLIAHGQRHPDMDFHFADPWDICPLDHLVMRGICLGLIKRGLLAGEFPDQLRITPTGQALDVTKQPNWKPLRRPSWASEMRA